MRSLCTEDGRCSQVAGVVDATVSFMSQKMKVEFADEADHGAIMQDVIKACKAVEEDCEIFV